MTAHRLCMFVQDDDKAAAREAETKHQAYSSLERTLRERTMALSAGRQRMTLLEEVVL